MIQIVFIDNGIRIAGIDYPNNHLVFGIERTTYIEIYNSGNKVISAPYTEFINERGEPFLSPQAIITALELTYVMGASQYDLDAEIAARIAGDNALNNRTSILENNEYKITYFEIVTGTSGSLAIPTGATINEGEFGASGNAVLSKIDGSNKPTIESPKDISGNVVTVSLNTDGSWVTSAAYTDISVAIIYSVRIKAVDYPNLTYANIVGEPEDIGTVSEYYRGDRTFQTLNTAAVTESLSNLYFTTTRVLATVLSGLNTALTGAITSSDTILQAFGKLQNSISNIVSASIINTTAFKVLTSSANNIQTAFEETDAALLRARNTGILSGGAYSGVSGTSITIASGEGGILNNTNPMSETYTRVVWNNTTLSVPSGLSYIYVNSSGTVTYATTEPSHEEYRLYIWLYRVNVISGNITAVNPIPMPLQQYAAGIWDVFRAIGLIRRDLVVSANGANLKLNISAGEIYNAGANFFTDSLSPHEVSFASSSAFTFRMATSSATTNVDITDLPVGSYDVGGTVTAIPGSSSRATIFTVYRFSAGNIRVLYGNAYYTSLTDAFTALSSYTPTPPSGYQNAIILGYIIAQKGATALNNTSQATFVLTNKFGGIGGAIGANFSGFLQIANNLSDILSPQAAKANLNIDKRTTVGDTNYTILTTDKEVVTSATLTASRTYTLPTGETAGQEFIVADEFQALGTYAITVGVATGKKLNGVTNGTVTMVTTGGHRRFFGDGNGNYTFDAGIARLGVNQTFTGTNTFSVAPVFTDYVGTRNAQKVYDMFMTNGNQTTTSSTASNITDLVSTTLTADKRYKIHGIIHVGCNNTGGVKIQITIPTGATVFLMTNGFTSGSTVNAWSGINASATLGAAFCTANSTGGCIMVNGEISLSSTAGTIQFGFASGVNTQTSTIYQLGTQITLTQIN